MREIPRDQLAMVPARRDVRVETTAGRKYDFERVRISPDSLYGESRLDVEGRFDQVQVVPLALDEVRKASARRLDWYRTGFLIGAAGAIAVAAILSGAGGDSGSGPAPGPCGPRPCP